MSQCIERFKNMCRSLYDNIQEQAECKMITLQQCRIRIISYGDFSNKGAKEILDSGFFDLPERNEAFLSFVNSLSATGSGNTNEERGLEAMSLAIESDWAKHQSSNKYRHLIFLLTDAQFDDKSNKDNKHYHSNLDQKLEDLYISWEEKMPRGKKLILFAPDLYPWADVSSSIDNCIHYPLCNLNDLNDFKYLLTDFIYEP